MATSSARSRYQRRGWSFHADLVNRSIGSLRVGFGRKDRATRTHRSQPRAMGMWRTGTPPRTRARARSPSPPLPRPIGDRRQRRRRRRSPRRRRPRSRPSTARSSTLSWDRGRAAPRRPPQERRAARARALQPAALAVRRASPGVSGHNRTRPPATELDSLRSRILGVSGGGGSRGSPSDVDYIGVVHGWPDL